MNREEWQHCSVCAWRETCKMKYSLGKSDNVALHCPEFTLDVRFKKREKKSATTEDNETIPKRYFSLD